MRIASRISMALLLLIAGAALFAGLISSRPYAEQYRDAISSPPSSTFPLGTDELGRDRLSRLLHGTQVSLLLAPAAALLSTAIAAASGGLAAFLGGRWERIFLSFTDMFISLPWFFLLLTVRALLPLNVAPLVSAAITFTLLGCLGWPTSARVIRAGLRGQLQSDYVLQAFAGGIGWVRILWRHLLPNVRPILLAQFWISIPVFILSEANLSLLGLGVAEPLPSLGSLLKELQSYALVAQRPWMIVPMLLLVVVVSCFQILLRTEEVSS